MQSKAAVQKRIEAAEAAICNRFFTRLFTEIGQLPPDRRDELADAVKNIVAGIDDWKVRSATMSGALEYLMDRVRDLDRGLAAKVMVADSIIHMEKNND